MSEQQNLRLVQQFYAAFQRGDIAGVLNAFADDSRWQSLELYLDTHAWAAAYRSAQSSAGR